MQGDPVIAHAPLDADAERAICEAGCPIDPAADGRRRSAATPNPARLIIAASSARTSGRTTQTAPGQGDDRIRHQLARTVVCHLAAAFGPDQLDPRAASSVAGPDVKACLRVGRASGRPDARQQGGCRHRPLGPGCGKLLRSAQTER
jgi:hypothetical protein